MRRTVIALAAIFAALLSSAHAADRSIMDARALVQKVRRGVITVHVADVRSEEHQIDWGGGSGFIFEIDYDKGLAYAITNHHVAGHASFVTISTWNGANYNGELVKSAPGIDIALIKVHGIPDERNVPDDQKSIMPVVLGDSDKVEIGELGMAMGSPGAQERVQISGADRSSPDADFQMAQTATLNVVTGRDTPLEFALQEWADGRNGGGNEQEVMGYQYGTDLDYTFRMSTAINGGNSGGPLFNKHGEVIAINTWSSNYGAVIQGVNASVPINLAKDFVYQVMNTGKFERPWIGLDVLFPPTVLGAGEVDPERAMQAYQEFMDRRSDRLEVYGIRKNSPADFVGIKKGDIILEVNGKKFKSPEELRHWVFTQDIGADVSFLIMRDGKLLRDRIKVNVGPKRTYDAEFSV